MRNIIITFYQPVFEKWRLLVIDVFPEKLTLKQTLVTKLDNIHLVVLSSIVLLLQHVLPSIGWVAIHESHIVVLSQVGNYERVPVMNHLYLADLVNLLDRNYNRGAMCLHLGMLILSQDSLRHNMSVVLSLQEDLLIF